MGNLDDFDDDLDLPDSEKDDGQVGVEDADALVSDDIEDGPEEVGLDTEVGSARDAGDLGALIDSDDELNSDPKANEPLGGFDVDLDEDESDENGWTRDSEGSNEVWDNDGFGDDDQTVEDDGGLEGVDDPMSDGISDELPALDAEDDEEDETLEDDLGDDWGSDLSIERRMRPANEGT